MVKSYLQSSFSANGEPSVLHAVTKSDRDEITLTLYGSDCSGNVSVRLTQQAWDKVISSLRAELAQADRVRTVDADSPHVVR